jgi:secreted trypsin-like serine protease
MSKTLLSRKIPDWKALSGFLVAGLALGCGTEPPASGEIVDTAESDIIGGAVSTVGAWPWQAQISLPGLPHACGGSLVALDWVLTAAHCAETSYLSAIPRPTSDFTIVLGEHDRSTVDGAEQARLVSAVHLHPNYPGGASPGHNDFALLRLTTPVTLNSRVQLIRPAVGADAAGQNAIASGWGNTSPGSGPSNLLMDATMPMATNAACDSAPLLTRNLFGDELCAGHLNGTTGACHGDSGGPLSVPRFGGVREQVGVVSWGEATLCGTYTVYARITSNVNWIRQYVFDTAILAIL